MVVFKSPFLFEKHSQETRPECRVIAYFLRFIKFSARSDLRDILDQYYTVKNTETLRQKKKNWPKPDKELIAG